MLLSVHIPSFILEFCVLETRSCEKEVLKNAPQRLLITTILLLGDSESLDEALRWISSIRFYREVYIDAL